MNFRCAAARDRTADCGFATTAPEAAVFKNSKKRRRRRRNRAMRGPSGGVRRYHGSAAGVLTSAGM